MSADPRDPKAVENKVKDRYAIGGDKWISATDANYGNPFWIRVADISGGGTVSAITALPDPAARD